MVFSSRFSSEGIHTGDGRLEEVMGVGKGMKRGGAQHSFSVLVALFFFFSFLMSSGASSDFGFPCLISPTACFIGLHSENPGLRFLAFKT